MSDSWSIFRFLACSAAFVLLYVACLSFNCHLVNSHPSQLSRLPVIRQNLSTCEIVLECHPVLCHLCPQFPSLLLVLSLSYSHTIFINLSSVFTSTSIAVNWLCQLQLLEIGKLVKSSQLVGNLVCLFHKQFSALLYSLLICHAKSVFVNPSSIFIWSIVSLD